MKIVTIRGKRQKQRANMVVKQISEPARARWEGEYLCLGESLQQEALAQWVLNETLPKGALITLIHYRQDCDCPGGYSESGTKACSGHEDFLITSCNGYRLRWHLEEYQNKRNCNGVVGYLNGVQIGCL